MEKPTITLPDYSQFELLIEAIEFASNNALKTKQRSDYKQLLRELETSTNPQNQQA